MTRYFCTEINASLAYTYAILARKYIYISSFESQPPNAESMLVQAPKYSNVEPLSGCAKKVARKGTCEQLLGREVKPRSSSLHN